MKVSQKIISKINQFDNGKLFNYHEFDLAENEYISAAKSIERLVKKGIIKKVSKGVFYKPEKTIFGELKPSENEILKNYLFNNQKRVAYLTGIALYNEMGLTTQIANTFQISSFNKRISTQIGNLKITSVKSYLPINNENYCLLQLLDVIKDFNIIPDLDKKQAILFLENQIQQLSPQNQSDLIQYAFKYPPRVQALLGAILENINLESNLLKNKLNVFTSFKMGISSNILPTISNWKIQ